MSPIHPLTEEERTRRREGANYKSTKAEIARRLDIIEEMYLSGRSGKIVAFCRDEFSIGRHQTDKYIKVVQKRIAARAKKTPEQRYQEALANLERLRDKSETNKDSKFSLDLLKEKHKIEGVYAPEKRETKLDLVSEIDEETLEAKILGMLEKTK